MAFSIRRMFSNITYFKKSQTNTDNVISDLENSLPIIVSEEPIMINLDHTKPDSTSHYSSSLKLPESLKNFAAKKGSFSDTDILNINVEMKPREKRRKCKKLKVDIKKASQSMNHLNNQENTPKHILLECKSSEMFTDKFKGFDFNKSFEFYESTSDEQISLLDDELGSFSEHTDSEISIPSKLPVKMCRKVEISNSKSSLEVNQLVPSVSPESFADIEIERGEEYAKLLQDYMLKFKELEGYTKKLLNDFQFHIEVSKLFAKVPDIEIKSANQISSRLSSCDLSPAGSWNILNSNEDHLTKCKLKKQLLSIKNCIDNFVHENLNNKNKQTESNSTYNFGHQRISYKKKLKHYDFPDLRDALINLFHKDSDSYTHETGLDYDESDCSNCHCKCHQYSQSDSGLTSKSQDQYMSITSSIGNFSLDSTTLTAYSESLDQIVSYNSFQDTSLYNTLLQKAAIERITFYVQVHSIQLKCELSGNDNQERSISFHCMPCTCVETDENGLLCHILSQSHCEKIHFAYKTAYIKKCVSAGKEIQPSTVLNPMRMYRDDNKIVCFGDALYACSLCFENLIIGESVLMAHCSEPTHIDRRERLTDIIG